MATNVEPITNYIQPVSSDSSMSSNSDDDSSSNLGNIMLKLNENIVKITKRGEIIK